MPQNSKPWPRLHIQDSGLGTGHHMLDRNKLRLLCSPHGFKWESSTQGVHTVYLNLGRETAVDTRLSRVWGTDLEQPKQLYRLESWFDSWTLLFTSDTPGRVSTEQLWEPGLGTPFLTLHKLCEL